MSVHAEILSRNDDVLRRIIRHDEFKKKGEKKVGATMTANMFDDAELWKSISSFVLSEFTKELVHKRHKEFTSDRWSVTLGSGRVVIAQWSPNQAWNQMT